MVELNPKVDDYLANGCGRCKYGGTPECKVHSWEGELKELRRILLACGLTEERKWGMPCYMAGGRNILIMSAFKEYCSVGFFKGALLKDAQGLLAAPGENSQAVRQLRFTSVAQIVEAEAVVKAYVKEAVALEASGKKVELKKEPEPRPEELEQKLAEDAELKAAFEGLTRGRQRGYILFFSAPKQSQTRVSRIEKCREQILEGKGLNER